MSQIIVCGLGQVGFRVVNLLLRLGEAVTVITMDSREEFEETVANAGARVIIGDARTDRHMRDAGVATADAVIACVDDDLTNIEIALDVTRMNPKCRMVVRLFDQNLGKRLEESLGIHRSLAMSALSAPTFASAALGEKVRGAFNWQGDNYLVLSMNADDPEIDRLIKHGATTLQRDETRARLVCKRMTFLDSTDGRERPVRRHGSRTKRYRRKLLRLFWENTPKLLKTVSTLIFALGVLSVFVFQYGLKLHPIDAVYFVITTMTTTGYGDITPRGAGIWMELYGCFLMLLGSAAVATLYSVITDFIVTARFDHILGRHRVTSREHVIVVGLGNVGYRVTTEIAALGGKVVAIDLDPNTDYRGLLNANIPFVAGDARDVETLELAGISQATAVIAATDDDAVNLSIGLIAKGLKPDLRTILRLFDGDLAIKIKDTLKVDAALSASRLAAPSFVGAALYDDALFCYLADETFVAVRGKELSDGISITERGLASSSTAP